MTDYPNIKARNEAIDKLQILVDELNKYVNFWAVGIKKKHKGYFKYSVEWSDVKGTNKKSISRKLWYEESSFHGTEKLIYYKMTVSLTSPTNRDMILEEKISYSKITEQLMERVLFGADSVGKLIDPATNKPVHMLSFQTLAAEGLKQIREYNQ